MCVAGVPTITWNGSGLVLPLGEGGEGAAEAMSVPDDLCVVVRRVRFSLSLSIYLSVCVCVC